VSIDLTLGIAATVVFVAMVAVAAAIIAITFDGIRAGVEMHAVTEQRDRPNLVLPDSDRRARVRVVEKLWSDEQRRAYEADKEEARRAHAARMSVEHFRDMKRENELAHGELTARFLASATETTP